MNLGGAVYSCPMDAVAWTQSQIRELKNQARELEAKIGHLEAWLELYANSADAAALATPPVESAASANGDAASARGSVADACAAILHEVGQTSTRQLTRRLVAAGRVKGDKPYATVYSAMHRQPERFRRVEHGQWALVAQLPTDSVASSPSGPPPPS